MVVDTTVQEKAIAHPTDARLTHRAIEKLVELAKREGVELRQSYLRLAKRAAIMVGRYTHAHQFKRARRELKFLRTRLGRIIRDIRRKIEGNTVLEDRFGPLLYLALRIRHQDQRQRGPKVYSLHAPEVECIGRGKARAQRTSVAMRQRCTKAMRRDAAVVPASASPLDRSSMATLGWSRRISMVATDGRSWVLDAAGYNFASPALSQVLPFCR